MEHTIYNTQGKEAGTISLPEEVFNAPWNNDLVHQVVVAMQANARTPIAHTKTRGEVSGTGRKPWNQKGSGQARHGSRRSPIWRTGGVAHGPRNDRDYAQKINKKMRVKALYSVLSKKLADGEVLFLDTFAFETPKTGEAKKIFQILAGITGFEKLATKRKNAVLISEVACEENTIKSFQNFGSVRHDHVKNLNPVDLLTYKYIIITNPEGAVETLKARAVKVVAKTLKKTDKKA